MKCFENINFLVKFKPRNYFKAHIDFVAKQFKRSITHITSQVNIVECGLLHGTIVKYAARHHQLWPWCMTLSSTQYVSLIIMFSQCSEIGHNHPSVVILSTKTLVTSIAGDVSSEVENKKNVTQIATGELLLKSVLTTIYHNCSVSCG